MKRNTNNILGLLLILFSINISANTLHTSPTAPPNCNAQFTDSTDINNPFLIHFYDLSSGNINSWSWDFGDGTSSNNQNPNHSYTNPGTYYVSLYVSDSINSCSDSITKTITISGNPPQCQAAFTYTASPTNNLNIQFTDASTGNPTSWAWNFGDGTTASLQNPIHIYNSSGIYSVTLFISSASCTDSVAVNVTVYSNPNPCQAAFSYSVNSNNNLDYSFSDQSQGNPFLWQWDFGDGSTSSAQNPNHIYAQAGNYSVSLKITTQSCIDSTTQQITVLPNSNTGSLLVYAYADSNYLDNSIVYLYQFDSLSGNIQIIDSSLAINVQGVTYYNFPNISQGYYYVYAKILNNSSAFGNFYNTWMPNTIYSQNADSILVNSANTYAFIQMAKSSVSYPLGNGSISGTVKSKNPGTNTPLSQVDVFLLLNDSNIITKTTTNQAGEYAFNNLAFGTYYIHPEMIGKNTQNKKVTIDFENTDEDSASFIVDGKQIVAGISSKYNMLSELKIYPNPVKDNLYIQSNLDWNIMIKIEILDIQGRVLYSDDYFLYTNAQKNIALPNLSKGLYFINLRSNNNSITKKFIKQ